jgi:thiamine biosynthesis lipoprotein
MVDVLPIRRVRRVAAGLTLLVAGALGVVACSQDAPPQDTRTLTGPTMGTTYHVTVRERRAGRDEARAQACIDRTLAAANEHLSTYAPDSEVSVLNRNDSTDWIGVSPTLLAVVAAAQRVSAESDGAFDITIAPLVRLWGFGSGAAEPGGSAAIDAEPFVPPAVEFIHDAMANVGYSWLELRADPTPAVRKGKVPLVLDLDGIAPGYAVDRISACLQRAGFRHHLVEIGGEVRAAGTRENGAPWRVAVETPTPGERQAYAGVQLRDQAISTSGGYRSFRRTADGRTVSHTIDPRIGEPVRHSVVSVTVVHPRATLADAYATALLVLGPDEGYALAERLGLPALFLERIGQSQALRERVTTEFQALRVPVRSASL